MPAPISGSPRASRVVSRQPVAASARATCQSSELPADSATASTSAVAATNGKWL